MMSTVEATQEATITYTNPTRMIVPEKKLESTLMYRLYWKYWWHRSSKYPENS